MLDRVFSAIFMLFIVCIIALTDIQTFAPILIGNPSYDSLDVLSGKLNTIEKCYVGKGANSMYVEVLSKQKIHSIKIPCDESLENKIGSEIEIRSRVIDLGFFELPPDVWSIRVDNSETLRYKDRINQKNNFLSNLLLCLIILLHLFLPFLFYKLKKLNVNQ